MMEPLSEQRISQGNPQLATLVRNAHDKMVAATGNGFRVAECVRTYAESNIDFAKVPKVSNARGGYSWHNFGNAVDCYPFTLNDSGALDWNANDAEFEVMVNFLKAEGLVWGGDWHTLKDYPHFQLNNIPVTPDDKVRQLFAIGGMVAVWSS